MKAIKLFKKYYEFFVTKLKVLREQKKYTHEGTEVKYMLKKVAGAESLAIVFSACTRPGLSARYNYVRTLDGMRCNRLYILDDFGPDGRGSYYLGHMNEFLEEKAVAALISRIVSDLKPDRVYFCGSCKGAYGALNFGISYPHSTIVIGEPTYRIATEFSKDENLMKYWMGDINDSNIHYIDYYLSDKIRNNTLAKTQSVYCFYSVKDEYYERHTLPLLDDLKSNAYALEFQEDTFELHADLGLYFADYLKTKISSLIAG